MRERRSLAAFALLLTSCASGGASSAPAATIGPPPMMTPDVERADVPPLTRAREHERAGDLYAAAEILNEAIQAQPDDPELRQARGELNAQMGYPRSAEADLQKAVSLDRSRAPTWVRLGQVRMELERFVAAAEAFEVARALRPGDASLLVFNARAYRGAGDFDRAGELYLRALEAGEESTDFLCELASLAASVGDRFFAARGLDPLELVDEAVERQPRCAKAWFVRGALLEARDDFVEAAEAYERASELEPERLDAWTNLALVRRQLGDHEGAAEAANRALALEPTSERQDRLERLLRR